MRKIAISAPARLHLGFVGLDGESASDFGALGLAIERPEVRVTAVESSDWQVSGPMSDKVRQYVKLLDTELGLHKPLRIRIENTIPSHVGLGSGTQLALAVGTALVRLNNSQVSLGRVSHLLRRGGRSGIGTAAFTDGGFLVDCQSDSDCEARTIARRLAFPNAWHILLIIDTAHQGAHGDVESEAFENLGGFSSSLTGELQGILLEQVIPSLEKANLCGFGEGISTIQRHVGDFFSSIQGGRYLSSDVAEMLEFAENSGAKGVGQSSWGPTGFVIMDSETSAHDLRAKMMVARKDEKLRFEVCRARNEGASITCE